MSVSVSSAADQDAFDTFSAEGPPSVITRGPSEGAPDEEVREKAGRTTLRVSPDGRGIWGVNVREISPGLGVGGEG